MRQELYNSLGLYQPSFFRIHIERDEDFSNYKLLGDIPAAVYLHEYIHFIQDITTNSGLVNMFNVSQYIKYCTTLIRENSIENFATPILPQYTFPINSNMDIVWYNLDHQKKYIGGIFPKDRKPTKYIGFEYTTLPFPQLDGSTKSTNQFFLKFNDQYDDEQKMILGSLALSESMAWEIETFIYGNILGDSSLYPYHSVRLLLNELFPELLSDPLVIVALCDVSLLDINPGRLFLELVHKLKSTNKTVFNPEDIYKLIFDFSFNVNGATNFYELLDVLGKSATDAINDYFTTNSFKDTPKWIEYNIREAIKLRKENPLFLIELCKGGKLSINKSFTEIYNKIGSPFVTNRQDESFFASVLNHSYDIYPEYLYAINQFYKMFHSPQGTTNRCQLKSWCKQSCHNQGISDFTDDRCNQNPWVRALDPDPNFCTYGRMWKTWGLSNISPL